MAPSVHAVRRGPRDRFEFAAPTCGIKSLATQNDVADNTPSWINFDLFQYFRTGQFVAALR
jgi:hypothetical protein